jgi:hypothetical protein
MNAWEWSQWAMALLVVGNLVLAAHQHGRTGRVSRDVASTAVALMASATLLTATGFW